MALVQVSHYSKCMKREVTFSAVLPAVNAEDDENSSSTRPMRSLYLLHGYGGNHMDWIRSSRIHELADRYRIAVFMPSGENRFFLDDEEKEEMLGEYTGKELVMFTRRMFPLSREREDTWIGGLSMGGYGAIRNGLKYAERFGRIIALSSALLPYSIANIRPDYHNGIAGYAYYRNVFGDLDRLLGSDKDPEALIALLKAENLEIPNIYMACGTEDFLLESNRRFHRFLEQENVEHTYDEGPGDHNWDFWNATIRDALARADAID
ncbi:alpha/beta hydrolase [Cohnella sp. 56]|uniref:alpha/beta hydrolase n=1 Tax=Cohnella sp. 56 TaxID=3113722 RepID=UPI0030E8CDD8